MTRKQNSLPRIPVRGTVHSYWVQQREARLAARKPKRRGASHKRASAQAKKPLDLWTPVG